MAFPSKTDREGVLAEAVEELRRVGLRELSLRRMAANLSVAPNALYRYFSNKGELEAALARECASRMLGAMQKAVGRKTGEHAIRGMAEAYLQFARNEPELYDMMLRPKGEKGPELWDYCLQLVASICGVKRAPRATISLWALLHGTAELRSKLLGFEKPEAAGSWQFGLDAWLHEAKRSKKEKRQ